MGRGGVEFSTSVRRPLACPFDACRPCLLQASGHGDSHAMKQRDVKLNLLTSRLLLGSCADIVGTRSVVKLENAEYLF